MSTEAWTAEERSVLCRQVVEKGKRRSEGARTMTDEWLADRPGVGVTDLDVAPMGDALFGLTMLAHEHHDGHIRTMRPAMPRGAAESKPAFPRPRALSHPSEIMSA